MAFVYPPGWLSPFVSWLAGMGILNTDMNRIEGNMLALANYFKAGTVDCKIIDTYLQTEVTGTIVWRKIENHVQIFIPELVGNPIDALNDPPQNELKISPDTVWPPEMLVNLFSGPTTVWGSVDCANSNTDNDFKARISLPVTDSDLLVGEVLTAAGYDKNAWLIGPFGEKGIRGGYIPYIGNY